MKPWHILVAANILACLVFGLDKLLAMTNSRRVPERTLWLFLAIGFPGGLAGMILFRHKTRKRSFLIGAIVPSLAGLALLAGAFFWLRR